MLSSSERRTGSCRRAEEYLLFRGLFYLGRCAKVSTLTDHMLINELTLLENVCASSRAQPKHEIKSEEPGWMNGWMRESI